MCWRRRAIVVITALAALFAADVTGAIAIFQANVSGGGLAVSTKRIFPGSRTTTAWDLKDASAGSTPVDTSDAGAFADGRTATSGNFGTTFSTSRYIDADFAAPLPSGIAVTGATLNFNYATSSGSGTTCVYFETRLQSTNAVLGTHGSATTPLSCNSTTTMLPTTRSLPEVTSTTTANNLKIRIYVRSSSSRAITIDLATVPVTTALVSTTLYAKSGTDASSGVPVTAPWAPATGDLVTYASAANWTSAFSTARYLRLTFPSFVPPGAVVSAVTLQHAFRSDTTGTTCYYLEVFSGTTLLATRYSAAAPSCTTITQVTNVMSVPEVTSAAQLNTLNIKIYVRNSGSSTSRHDLVALVASYSLD